MSEKLLVEEAKRRRRIFENLPFYLDLILKTVRELDGRAEVYLFGSVAEDRHLLSSDIDVLVITERDPGTIMAKLWEKGISDPFEIHVATRDMFEIYKRRSKLLNVEELLGRMSQ